MVSSGLVVDFESSFVYMYIDLMKEYLIYKSSWLNGFEKLSDFIFVFFFVKLEFS